MGRKNNPSLIYDWISQHGAETKKTVGNSKNIAHSNCSLYLVLIQKFPTLKTVGELFFAFRSFTDLDGLVKCLNTWLNALATMEGIRLVEIGVGTLSIQVWSLQWHPFLPLRAKASLHGSSLWPTCSMDRQEDVHWLQQIQKCLKTPFPTGHLLHPRRTLLHLLCLCSSAVSQWRVSQANQHG